MAANKVKGELFREELITYIARLTNRGWSQWQVRDELQREKGVNLSQQMIGYYLKEIRKRNNESFDKDRQQHVKQILEAYKEVRREAWLAYDRSMHDTHKEVEQFAESKEYVGIGDYVTSEERIGRIVTVEGRLPDNGYLKTIMTTLQSERELLGLDECKPGLVTIEQAMALLGAFKDAAREVLSQHPELLRALYNRTTAIAPVPMEREKVT